MRSALTLFKENIEQAKQLSSLYEYLLTKKFPLSFDDILRSQVVYTVSAFDKFMHDLIRIGMVEIFSGIRSKTPRYLSETISIEVCLDLESATILPKEYVFEQAVFNKLKSIAYQDPNKVAEGLSYIWNEKQKWKKIAINMSMNENEVKTKLKLIVSRRNAIVHEADIDPITGKKYLINRDDCDTITDFLNSCGQEIFNLVSLPE